MLVLFLIFVVLVTYGYVIKFSKMADRHKWHIAVHGDLDLEEAELLTILMALMCVVAAVILSCILINWLPGLH